MESVELPEFLSFAELELGDGVLNNPWQAVLYTCDCHTYTQVIQQLTRAIRCSREVAYELAWTVHHHGQAIVYLGMQPECERIVSILRDIGLRAAVEQT